MYYKIDSRGNYYVPGQYSETYVIISDVTNPPQYNNDFYFYWVDVLLHPGVKNGELYRAAEWCEENCSKAWLAGLNTSAFVDEMDAMAFKLRWL